MKQLHPIQAQILAAAMLAGFVSIPAWRAEAQSPFNGYRFGLPATIEAEMFDLGGQNYGYFSAGNTNVPGKYRTDGVCIYRNKDWGSDNTGYCVGNVWPNDWLNYSITCWETATYRIEVRTRIPQPTTATCRFKILIDASDVTGWTNLSNASTNWQVVTTTTTSPINSGDHALKLLFGSGDPSGGVGFFDYLTIYKVPPAPSNAGYTTNVTLSSGTNVTTAKANATALQNAINSLPSGGGTIQLSGSGPYYICQPNPVETAVAITTNAAPARPPLVLNVTQFSSTVRNNYSGYVGFQFTTGSSQVLVASLGRWVYPGNSGSHQLVLTDSGGNILSDGNGHSAQVTLNTSNQEAGFFAYTNLPAVFTLNANTTYAVMSQESSGGDYWYNNQGTDITLDGVASGAWGSMRAVSPATRWPPILPARPTAR